MHQTTETIEPMTETELVEFAEFEAQVADEFATHDRTPPLAPERFCVYEEIRTALAARGIPRHEVAFIQEARTRTARLELFRAMRSGSVRVLLCSKQSTGMNIQTRLIALHHVDVPWRPGDLDQRSGRIERQGNAWPEFYEFTYPTAHSLDGLRWQAIETKSGFIHQMKQRNVTDRSIEDLSELTVSAAELKALASGNPKIVQRFALESELRKLESLRAAWADTKRQMQRRLTQIASIRSSHQQRSADLQAAQERITPPTPEFKAALIQGVLAASETQIVTKREAAGEQLLHVLAEVGAMAVTKRERVTLTLGMYRGLFVRGMGSAFDSTMLTLTTPKGVVVGELATKTATGVFQSADHCIRTLPMSIQTIQDAITQADHETDQIHAALAAPWEQEQEYQRVAAQFDTLDHELSRDQPADTDEGDLSTIEIIQPMRRPIVFLPEPDNPAAMTAAMQRLARAAHTQSSAVPATPPAIDATPEQVDVAPAAILDIPAEVLEPLPGALAAESRLGAAPTQHSPPQAVPTFGHVLNNFSRRKALTPTPVSTGTRQLDLFSMPPADNQTTLWDLPPAH